MYGFLLHLCLKKVQYNSKGKFGSICRNILKYKSGKVANINKIIVIAIIYNPFTREVFIHLIILITCRYKNIINYLSTVNYLQH